jgi:hypothetical protein
LRSIRYLNRLSAKFLTGKVSPEPLRSLPGTSVIRWTKIALIAVGAASLLRPGGRTIRGHSCPRHELVLLRTIAMKQFWLAST